MIVIVKRNSATSTPVDVGEGEAAQRKIEALVNEHGASCVTMQNGEPVQMGSVAVPSAKPAKKRAKANAKRKKK